MTDTKKTGAKTNSVRRQMIKLQNEPRQIDLALIQQRQNYWW